MSISSSIRIPLKMDLNHIQHGHLSYWHAYQQEDNGIIFYDKQASITTTESTNKHKFLIHNIE